MLEALSSTTERLEGLMSRENVVFSILPRVKSFYLLFHEEIGCGDTQKTRVVERAEIIKRNVW